MVVFGKNKKGTYPGPFQYQLNLLGLKWRYAALVVSSITLMAFILSLVLLAQLFFTVKHIKTVYRQRITTELMGRMEKRARFMAFFIAENLVNPVYGNDFGKITDILIAAKNQEEVAFVYLFDRDGKVVHDGSMEINIRGMPWMEPQEMEVLDARYSAVSKVSENLIVVSTGIRIGDKLLGGISLGLSLEDTQAAAKGFDNGFRDESRRLLWVAALCCVFTAFLFSCAGLVLSFFGAERFVRPLEKISAHARKIGYEGISVPAPEIGGNELGVLAEDLSRINCRFQSMAASKAYLEAAVESMGDCFVTLDSHGFIKYANRALCALLDYRFEELPGEGFETLFPEKDQMAIMGWLGDIAKGEKGNHQDLRFLTGRGEIVPVSVIGSAILGDENQATGYVFVAQEISERMKKQNQLAMAVEEAEAASRSKSAFLASMSHEFRTPLNHIIGFTEMIADKEFGDINPRQEEYLRDTLSSSLHLLSLVNDILDISKVEAGKMELELGQVDLSGLLEGSLSMISNKALRNNISVSSSVNGLPELMLLDERKMKQVVFNLLSNAAKFTPKRGKIKLSARCVTLALSGKGTDSSWAEVTVEDSGEGISPENLKTIFDPFVQSRGGSFAKEQGTGLGLALCRQFIELHGGTIWAESEGAGKGSTFKFRLPLGSIPAHN